MLKGLDIDTDNGAGKALLENMVANPDTAKDVLAKVAQAKALQTQMDALNKGLKPPVNIDSKALFAQALSGIVGEFKGELTPEEENGTADTMKSKIWAMMKELLAIAVDIGMDAAIGALKSS